MRQASRGGGHTLQFDTTGSGATGTPEHIRDIAMLRDAIAKVESQATAKRINGDAKAKDAYRYLRVLKSLSMHISGSIWATLTDRQRSMCMKTLGLTELPRVPEATVPAVLRVLPMKPPPRKMADDE